MWKSFFVVFLFAGCVPFTSEGPLPGPDKRASGMLGGAGLGAGAGAVTAFQVGTSTGAGAWVGAGLGAVYGGLVGAGLDQLELDQHLRIKEAERLRELLWVQETLAAHYERRIDLHPNREIFPADLFFIQDSAELKPGGEALAEGVASLIKNRLPWSRLEIRAYVTAKDTDSEFADFLTRSRAEKLAGAFVRAGIEPRRLVAVPVILPEPILVDPYDQPDRYYQALELVYVDKNS